MPTRQHNVRPHGPTPFQGDADLTDKENHIVTITATGVDLTANDTDHAFGVVQDGKTVADKSSIIPFVPGHPYRVKSSGVIAHGDKVCPDGANAGRSKKALVGDVPFGIAIEAGVDDQDVLIVAIATNEAL